MIRLLFTITFILSPLMAANDKASACASIKNDKNRLACYDQFYKPKAASVNRGIRNNIPQSPDLRKMQSQRKTQKANTNKEPVAKKEASDDDKFFGLNQKQIKEAKNVKEDSSIGSSIKNAKISITGKFSIKLENGQTWQSFTSVPLTKTRIFKSGNKINIKKARLGGFWLRDDETGIQIKVKRIK